MIISLENGSNFRTLRGAVPRYGSYGTRHDLRAEFINKRSNKRVGGDSLLRLFLEHDLVRLGNCMGGVVARCAILDIQLHDGAKILG